MGRPFDPPKQDRPRGISRRKFLGQAAGAAALSMASSHKVVAALDQGGGTAALLRVDASKAVSSFDPDKSLGSSMDELSLEVIQKIYTPEMVRQWLAARWGPIHQVYAGMLLDDGTSLDLVRHSPDATQTPSYCSSTDPYHAATDLNKRGDQTGFDLFFTSGINNNLPAMILVAVLFSTPEDAAHQIAYLKKRGYPVAWVEMGEECDGQYMMPEDYAALYIQFADAIHKVAPETKLGGPVFQGINQDVSVWPDAENRTSWFGRFLDYLKSHDHIQDLAFVSFEHYPFDPCSVNWADLYREPDQKLPGCVSPGWLA
jgi:hypothetical protein